jgi:nucleoside-diphosphate-sugar epimerase
VKIAISGSSGFLGVNLIEHLKGIISIFALKRDEIIVDNLVGVQAVINLAGFAHDLQVAADPSYYYQVNTDYSNRLFDAFLASDAKVFITISSVKAVAEATHEMLTEDSSPNPQTHYGKSKLMAEYYIQTKRIPAGKRVYILRPCMIHGPGNKGNLNLLYKIAKWGLPWPLASFENKRSFCSVENICFVIRELLSREDIPSGIYHIADDEPLSTNQVIQILGESLGKQPMFWKVPQSIIRAIARLGDFTRLPLNSERLSKLTESYVVSNKKIIDAMGKSLPVNAQDGLKYTFQSFNK